MSSWIEPKDAALILLFGVALLLLNHICRSFRFAARARGQPLPPGPTPLPIVGNLLDVPQKSPWLRYHEWSKTYGSGLIYLRPLNQSLIIINDYKTLVELFERRSSIYSSRPDSPMIPLLGWEWSIGLLPYGPRWRLQRRILWQNIHQGAVPKYHGAQEYSAGKLLARLLHSPENLHEHIRYSFGGMTIEAIYGLRIAEENDKYISLFEESIASLDFLIPGSSILEYFPWLAKFPTWLPGTGTLRQLAHWRESLRQVRAMPWRDAQNSELVADDRPSMARSMLASFSDPPDPAELEAAKSVAAASYAAGLDTQQATLIAFLVAMYLYPDVQKRAQAELDAVVGSHRLPRLSDRSKLPFLNAVLKETMRWHVVVPLALPHLNTEDDVYEGMFIPANSTVLANTWAMLYDPDVYPDPEVFIPDRFLKEGKLDSNVRDPTIVAFGVGRRICPGRYFAESALFIYMASVLHTFTISAPLGEDGTPDLTLPQVTTGLLSRMEDVRCVILPRSEEAMALIQPEQ